MTESKDVWGPRTWAALHKYAIYYPRRPTALRQQAAFEYILNTLESLPCDECRGHALRYLRTHPPTLKNNETLQNWVYNFHNAVNHRLGKRIMPVHEYKVEYARLILDAGRL